MRFALPFLLIAALASCGRPDAVDKDAEGAAALPEPINQSSHSPTGGPSRNDVVTAEGGAGATPIPAAIQGRWGLTPADCMSSRGDAKGLLEISGNELRFYESVATPGPEVLTTDDTIGGNFNFTGEGQSWTKYQNLQVRRGQLTRTERNPIASFRYVRCD